MATSRFFLLQGFSLIPNLDAAILLHSVQYPPLGFRSASFFSGSPSHSISKGHEGPDPRVRLRQVFLQVCRLSGPTTCR
ncbi:hypothetical protein C8R45DRAFT_1045924 [Mycena sanguinolenta]|nr:hypothetical protein C8R45DRAFT_1045924 [Mycena sanguinolenta]